MIFNELEILTIAFLGQLVYNKMCCVCGSLLTKFLSLTFSHSIYFSLQAKIAIHKQEDYTKIVNSRLLVIEIRKGSNLLPKLDKTGKFLVGR